MRDLEFVVGRGPLQLLYHSETQIKTLHLLRFREHLKPVDIALL